jgi:hypothetical protein
VSRRLRKARRLKAAGVSMLPIADDGSKGPAWWLLPNVWDPNEQRWKPTWKPFQRRFPTDDELVSWFSNENIGIGLITGQISGGVESLDFDAQEIFDPWCAMVQEVAPGLVQRLPLSQTPTMGHHTTYR